MNRGQIWLKAAVLGVLAAIPLLFFGCKRGSEQTADAWPDRPGKRIVVSFAPLYCFVASVAGDDAVVKNTMTSRGPHDFDPTADDVRLVTKADLFFVVGLGLDDHPAEKMRDGSGNTKLKVVKLGDKIDKKFLCEGKCTHGPEHGDHKHDTDPHVWLSPDHAALLVGFIRDELKAADPEHAAGYEKRAADYIVKLKALKQYGADKFKDKTDKRLVSFHDSLAYFEEAYQLDVRGVLTKKAGQEPEAAEMTELIRLCTKKTAPTRVIATEPQYSRSNSGEQLRKELLNKGVAEPVLVEFDPLETVKPEDLKPDWYEAKMRENIDALAKAMK